MPTSVPGEEYEGQVFRISRSVDSFDKKGNLIFYRDQVYKQESVLVAMTDTWRGQIYVGVLKPSTEWHESLERFRGGELDEFLWGHHWTNPIRQVRFDAYRG